MENLRDVEEMRLCPYNSAHNIKVSRMNFHLVKCAKNFVGQFPLVPCDFNTTHRIPQPEVQYHSMICPDRKPIEAQIVATAQTTNPYPILGPHTADARQAVQEESWDNIDVPTYDPKKQTEDRPVLRRMDVESGAKRKNFRMQERERMKTITNTGSVPAGPNQGPVPMCPAHQPTLFSPSVHSVPQSLPPHRRQMEIVDKEKLADQIKAGSSKVYLQHYND